MGARRTYPCLRLSTFMPLAWLALLVGTPQVLAPPSPFACDGLSRVLHANARDGPGWACGMYGAAYPQGARARARRGQCAGDARLPIWLLVGSGWILVGERELNPARLQCSGAVLRWLPVCSACIVCLRIYGWLTSPLAKTASACGRWGARCLRPRCLDCLLASCPTGRSLGFRPPRLGQMTSCC